MTDPAIKISDAIYAELTATCDAIGYNNGSTLLLDKNCIEAIKDLIRYLRRDDDSHSVRRYLGQSKLLQKDLLKIFTEHSDKTELWNVLLRLLINLTSPAISIYHDEIPTDKITRSYYLQILSHLQEYKCAMTNDSIWIVVQEKLKEILKIDPAERGEENDLIIERILTLIRNVLRVPPSDLECRTDNDTSVHDLVLYALHTSGIPDLLVFIASTSKEHLYHMQILEIIAFMLRDQNPARLARAELHRTEAEKQKDEAKLLVLRQKEQAEKMAKMKKYAGSRHSRFGGVFVVQNMKAIGNNEMICHKPYQNIEDLNFSVTKQKTKKRVNKNEPVPLSEERTSAMSVRLFLKEFCIEFLKGAYNTVMRHARTWIDGNPSDTSHYLWALRFFMAFNRYYKFRVKFVSETISTEVFYTVQRQIENNYEMIITDKKKAASYSRKMHLGLKAYQELLYTLIEMDKSADVGVKNSSRVIMNNIFYVPEYRDTILSQLLNYNENNMSKDYLVDLVMTTHIFLKMLKNFCEKERHVVVQKKKRKKPVRKPKATKSGATGAAATPASLEDQWDSVGQEVSAVMQQNAIPEVVPFDATSDTPIDEQKGDAMKRIQRLLRSKEYEQAIGLLRSARDVWPENDSFGRANMPPEEEFLVLREIFLADLGVPVDAPTQNSENQRDPSNEIENLLNYEEEEEDEEDDEETEQPRFEESSFKFMEFLQRFANMRVVINLTILFKQFDKNSLELNHCILKMYHRIAVECKMPAMLYQASIFRVFQKIFHSDDRSHKELVVFARFIFRGFAEVAVKNPKAYMELLFWKSTKQAVEMTDGYDTEHATNKKASRNAWTEVEEDELRTLFMEHQTNKPAQDLVDFIQSNLINQDRTRRGIIKKIKELGLVVNSKRVRDEVRKRLPKEWSEDEIAQLTELWEQVKEDDEVADPLGIIYDGLRIKRPRPRIKEKLLELNLVDDPKQLRKKRVRKRDGPKSSWEAQSASEDEDGEEDEDEDGSRSGSDSGAAASSSRREKKKKERSKRPKKKSKQPEIVYTDAQLTGLLKDVIAKELTSPLEWLKESLEDWLEDRDEESGEAQALVPLDAQVSEALDAPSFQKFLRALGVHSPDLEEAYWRIPASLLPSTVTRRISLIEAALRGEFVEEAEPAKENKAQSESESDGELFKKLKSYNRNYDQPSSSDDDDAGAEPKSQVSQSASHKSASKAAENNSTSSRNSASPGSDKENQDAGETDRSSTARQISQSTRASRGSSSSSDSGSEKTSQKPDSDSSEEDSSEEDSNKSKRPRDPDSDSNSNPAGMRRENQRQSQTLTGSQPNGGSAKSRRIRKVLNSDSEEESEKLPPSPIQSSVESKRNISQDSDSETPIQKRRRVLDSDEEENELPESEKSTERKQARVLSDDED